MHMSRLFALGLGLALTTGAAVAQDRMKVAIGQRVMLFSERNAKIELAGSVLRIAAAFGKPGEAQNEARSVEVVLKIEGGAGQGLILGERLVARFLP